MEGDVAGGQEALAREGEGRAPGVPEGQGGLRGHRRLQGLPEGGEPIQRPPEGQGLARQGEGQGQGQGEGQGGGEAAGGARGHAEAATHCRGGALHEGEQGQGLQLEDGQRGLGAVGRRGSEEVRRRVEADAEGLRGEVQGIPEDRRGQEVLAVEGCLRQEEQGEQGQGKVPWWRVRSEGAQEAARPLLHLRRGKAGGHR
mmetsp:Transcript_113380/g.316759  ORF Transcript_113380/g.316759 Transcript_113380/m.316759 type:complete len:200 (+) Transcript_113380:2703-3302(+)